VKSPISRPQRAAIRLQYLRELYRYETALAQRIARIIESQGKYLARWYRFGHEPSEHLLLVHKQTFSDLLKSYYRRVMVTFYQKLTRSLKTSVFQDALQAWLTRQTIDTVNSVDDTTVSIVKNIVRNGLANSLTMEQIAAAIEDATDFDNVLPRATAIARTEMHAAMNFAQLTAAKDTGLKLVKVWTSSLDDRTREAHAEADGQTVDIDDDFDVDGEAVSRPGEGDPENSINCRCCLIFTRAAESDSVSDTQ
jgi:hypothetical protein